MAFCALKVGTEEVGSRAYIALVLVVGAEEGDRKEGEKCRSRWADQP